MVCHVLVERYLQCREIEYFWYAISAAQFDIVQTMRHLVLHALHTEQACQRVISNY